MTTAYWIGPAGSGQRMSGYYVTAANWSTGAVPGVTEQGEDDVYLPAGAYTVTLEFGAVSLRSMSIGVGATLAIADGDLGALELIQSSVNDGTLSFGLDNLGVFHAGFYNFGSLLSTADNVRLLGGTIFNTGQIVANGSLSIASDIVNDAGGTIRAAAGMALGGTVTNSGAIVADHADIIFQPNTSTLTNLVNRVLTGGTYAALGQANIYFYQGIVTVLATGADVTLDGAGSNIGGVEQGVPRTLDTTLTRVDTGAALHILGARNYTTTNAIVLGGTLELGGGAFASGQLNARAGSLVTGFGTITARATLEGEVVATDTLTFATRTTVTGAVSGKGTFALTADANTIGASAITVSNLAISGDTKLGVDLAYARHFTLSGAVLDIGAHQLRLTGTADLADARIDGFGSGLLRLAGGHLASTGHSLVTVNTTNTGTIEVTSGELDIARKLAGIGTLAIGDGATLAFTGTATVAAAQTISFADGHGTLRIANIAHFHAGLSEFGAGDAIDLTGVAAAGTKLRWTADADGAGGTLRLSNAGSVARLHIADGQYTRADFALTDDGAGGTLVTNVAAAAFHTAPAAAFVAHDMGHADLPAFHEPFHPAGLTMLV